MIEELYDFFFEEEYYMIINYIVLWIFKKINHIIKYRLIPRKTFPKTPPRQSLRY